MQFERFDRLHKVYIGIKYLTMFNISKYHKFKFSNPLNSLKYLLRLCKLSVVNISEVMQASTLLT